MVRLHCIQKFRDKNNKIIAYDVKNIDNNKRFVVQAESIRGMLKNKEIAFDNLQLTSDNRVIDSKEDKEEVKKEIKTEENKGYKIAEQLTNMILKILSKTKHSCSHKPIVTDSDNGMVKIEYNDLLWNIQLDDNENNKISISNQMTIVYNKHDIRQTYIKFKFCHLPNPIVSKNSEHKRYLSEGDIQQLIYDINVLNYTFAKTIELYQKSNSDYMLDPINKNVYRILVDSKLCTTVNIGTENHKVTMSITSLEFYDRSESEVEDFDDEFRLKKFDKEYSYNYNDSNSNYAKELDKMFESYRSLIVELYESYVPGGKDDYALGYGSGDNFSENIKKMLGLVTGYGYFDYESDDENLYYSKLSPSIGITPGGAIYNKFDDIRKSIDRELKRNKGIESHNMLASIYNSDPHATGYMEYKDIKISAEVMLYLYVKYTNNHNQIQVGYFAWDGFEEIDYDYVKKHKDTNNSTISMRIDTVDDFIKLREKICKMIKKGIRQ